jgi:hypothetical protein
MHLRRAIAGGPTFQHKAVKTIVHSSDRSSLPDHRFELGRDSGVRRGRRTASGVSRRLAMRHSDARQILGCTKGRGTPSTRLASGQDRITPAPASDIERLAGGSRSRVPPAAALC